MRMFAGMLILLALALLADAAAPPTPAIDADGDALPHAVAARLGTTKWRTGWYVSDVVYSPDSKYLATADNSQRTAKIWDAATGKLMQTMYGHMESVVGVAFSPDGKRLLTTSYDKSLRVWNLDGEQLYKFELEHAAEKATFTADGKVIVALDTMGRLLRFSAQGKELGQMDLGRYSNRVLSRDGSRVAMCANDRPGQELRICDAKGKFIAEFASGVLPDMPALSPDGKYVAATTQNKSVKVWDVASGKELCALSTDEVGKEISRLTFTSDGKRLLGETEKRKLRLWDITTGKRVVEFEGENSHVFARAFSPDGKRLVLTNAPTFRIFDVAKGTRLNPSEDAEGCAYAIAFSPDGKHLLVGHADDEPCLWDVKSRQVVKRLPFGEDAGQKRVDCIAYSRDGKLAAGVGYQSPLWVWEVASGKLLHRFETKIHAPQAVVFSADSNTLFVAGLKDGVLRWDLRTARSLPAIKPPRADSVVDLQLTDEGKLMIHVTAATILWDPVKDEELRRIPLSTSVRRATSDGESVYGVDFDGKYNVYTSSSGKPARQWLGSRTHTLRISPDEKYLAGVTGRVLHISETKDGQAFRPIISEYGNFLRMAFSPDGSLLAVTDGPCVMLYDTRSLPRIPVHRLSRGSWRWCWETLGDSQPYVIVEAQQMLLAAGDAWIPLARERLTPKLPDYKNAAWLIKAAASEVEETAEQALLSLVKLGPGVRPLIEAALKEEADADVKLRLIVARTRMPVANPGGDFVRAGMLVEVLRKMKTKESESLLADLVAGAAGDVWQKAAKRTK